MADKPKSDDEKRDDERFERTVKNLLKAPPKPHKPKGTKGGKKD